jgi:hypothetical protein
MLGMVDRRWTNDEDLPPIGDEAMRAAMGATRPYSVVILRDGPRADHPDRDAIVWEHGRRNFRLRAAGLLVIVLPVRDDSAVDGIGIFDLDPDETRAVMEADPGVQAGLFTFEVHPARSFPGDRLPAAPPQQAQQAARRRKPEHPAAKAVEHRHADGTLWSHGLMLDGEQHGDWEWFRSDGTRMRSGSFDRGTQVGVWTTYDRTGAVVRRTRFPGPAGSATDHTTDDPHTGDV